MKALFIIAEYTLHEKINKILSKVDVPFKIVAHGNGTADSKILDYLGLGDNKKIVFIGIINDNDTERLYKVLEYHLSLSRAGRGIAFTVPLSGASATLVKIYEAQALANKSCETNLENEKMQLNNVSNDSKGENEKMDSYQHELIITIVSRGSFAIVREAAKSAGARGGTLIHGLGIGGEEAAKFLGIMIQPEKDIILIVVNKEDKASVMKSILASVGMITEHKGVCFSVPVDSAFGLANKFDIDVNDANIE